MSEKEPTREPSIEEIAAQQRAHEEEVLVEKREAEEAAERERQLKAQAGEDYDKRLDLLAELKAADVEAKKMLAEGIQERMAQADRLRGLKAEREAALTGLQEEIKLAGERLGQIEGLVAGKSEEMVAETTRKALAAAKAKSQDLDGQARDLSSEIGKIGEQIVSDEMVKRYQELLTQSSELNGQIDEISANPALVELMEKEAIDENKVRNEIVRAAISQCQRQYGRFPTDERRAFIAQLAETFITEEFQAKEIDQIKDPQERTRAMNAWRIRVADGIINGDYEKIARMDPQEQTDRWPGLVLRNLVGGHGTLGGTMHLMVTTEIGQIRLGAWEGRNVDRERERTPAAVQRYLRTLNLIKAYNEGMATNRLRSEVVGNATDNWGEFDRRYMLTRDFENHPNSPLIPKDADPALRQQLTEEFGNNKAQAQKIDQALTDKEAQEKQAAIEELTRQIAEIDVAIKAIEDAQKVNKDRPIEYRDLEEREKGLESLRNEQEQIGRDIQRLQEQLSDLGFFARSDRRNLNERIKQKQARSGWIRANLPKFEGDAQKIRQALESMNKYRAKNLYDFRDQRAALQRNLERIQKGY